MVIPVRLLACFTAALFIPLAGARAESSVQDLVFENCEAARDKAAQLSADERRALFEFLPRVITLNTQAPAAPELLAQMPGQARPGELGAGPAWHTRDAKREVRGKRCAIELLEEAGAAALGTLPVLAEIYSRENLSDEIAVALEEAAATIAEQAHKQGLYPDDKELENAVRLLETGHPLIAQNFLHEYVGVSLPHVIRHLSMLDGTDGQKVARFLSEADPDGSRSMRVFLDLLVSLPDEQQRRLARQIPLPLPQALQSFLPELSRLAADSAKSPAFMPLLGKACLAVGSLMLDASSAAALAQRSSFDQLELEEQRCLLRAAPGLSKRVVAMLSSSDPDEQLNAMSLFSLTPKAFSAEQRTAAWARIRELADSQDTSVRRAALKSLVSSPDKRAEAAAAISKTLSEPVPAGEQPSPSRRELAFEAMAEMQLSKESSSLVPVALAAVTSSSPAPGAVAFLAKAEEADPSLLDALSGRDPVAANGALLVLKNMKKLPKKAVDPAFLLLSNPLTSRGAEEALLKLAPAAAGPRIKSLLPRAQEPARTALLALLQSFGLASKSESAELAAALSVEGCSQLVGRASAVEKILARRDLEPAVQASLRDRCALCLGELPEQDAKALLAGSFASAISQSPALARAFAGGGLSDEIQDQLLSLILDSSSASEPMTAVAQEVLTHGSRASRMKILQSATLQYFGSSGVLAAIQEVAKHSGNDEQLRSAAVNALAALGDQSFGWRELVREMIEAVGKDEQALESVRDTLKLIPVAVVLEEVAPALESDDRERLIGACRIGAALGPQAIPIVSKVWSLRDKNDPAVRYAAVLALLEINPLTPDLQEQVRRLLVNRYYPSALNAPVQWKSSVAVVDLQPASFGTLREVRLERLLKANRGHTDEQRP